MDGIIVDMLGCWLRQYNMLTGENTKEEEIINWDVTGQVKHPEILEGILGQPGFFFNMPQINEARKYITKLIEEGHNVIILTQPPRRSDHAVKDKRDWIQANIPGFDSTNIIFAHKKYLIGGDILFDDRASHLDAWKKYWKERRGTEHTTAMIQYPYNRNYNADWVFKKKERAWEEFYNLIKKNS